MLTHFETCRSDVARNLAAEVPIANNAPGCAASRCTLLHVAARLPLPRQLRPANGAGTVANCRLFPETELL